MAPFRGPNHAAGSASRGSNASSARADERRVDAEPGRHDPDHRARRGQACRSSSASSVSRTNGWIRPWRPPRTMSRGLRTLTRPAEPDPEPAADVRRAPQPPAPSLLPPRAGPRPRRRGPRRGGSRPVRRSAPSPTSVSQHPIEPQRHCAPSGLTGRWPISPAYPARPGQRAPADDHAAADADLARDEQQVVDAHRRAAPVLGQRAQVGIVGDRDRDVDRELARQQAPPSGTSTQPRLGAIDTSPSLRRTTPATATPMPISGPSRRAARSVSASAARSATIVVDGEVAARAVDAHLAR